MRTLEVYLLALLACAVQAHAAGEMGQIWFGAHAPAGGSATPTPRYHSTDVGGITNVADDSKFKMPSAGKLRNLVVKCEGAPGSGKTFRWLARIWHGTDSPHGTLTCDITGNTETTCQDYTNADDFEAEDRLTFQVTTLGGTATARDCVIGVQVGGVGVATPPPTPARSLIIFGDATAVAPSGTTTSFGAPSITAATQQINTTTESIAAFMVPGSDMTFKRFCVWLGSAPLTGTKSETFYLHNSRTGADAPSLGLKLAGNNGYTQERCTDEFSMDANPGDLLSIKFNRDNTTGHTKTRMITIEYTGGGGWIGSSAPWTSSTTKYYTMQEGTNSLPSSLPQRVSQSGVIRNLYAKASSSPPTPQVITLYSGTSSSAMSAQALKVTVPTVLRSGSGFPRNGHVR